MKNPEDRVTYILSLMQKAGFKDISRESKIKGTPVWRICWDPAAFERVKKWLEQKVFPKERNLKLNI